MIWNMIEYVTEDYLADFALIFLQSIFLAVWRALPLLAIAIVVGMLFRRKLAAKYHAVLWSLVVIRLLMPVSVSSAWSIHGPIMHAMVKLFEDNSPPRDAVLSTTAASPKETTTFRAAGSTYHLDVDQPNSIPGEPPAKAVADWELPVIVLIITSCAAVAVGLILRSVLAHALFAGKLARCNAIDNQDLVSMLDRECKSLRIKRVPQMKEVPGLAAPAVFGLVKSTICLPVSFIGSVSADELRWVLRHELAHIGRFDTWMMTLASVARSFHWMNPLAWFTVAKLRSKVEAAADQIAVGSDSVAAAAAYGRLLIRIAEDANGVRSSAALGLLPFAAKRTLKKRIEILATGYGPNRRWITWTFAVATAAIIAVAFTDDAEVVAASQVANYPPHNFELTANELNDVEASHLKEYDVAAVIEKLRRSEYWGGATPSPLAIEKSFQYMFDGKDLYLENETLFANLTSRQHERLSRILTAWEEQGPQQVAIEFRIIDTSLLVASRVDWGSNRIESIEHQGTQPILAKKMSDAEMRLFLNDVFSNLESNCIQAPKITLYHGQCATFDNSYKKPFVVGVKPDLALEPIVEVKRIGLHATFSPRVRDNNVLEFTFDMHSTRLVEERLAKLPYRLSKERTEPMYSYATVEAPVISSESVSSTLEIAPTETILIAVTKASEALKSDDSERIAIYAITPRILSMD